MGRLILKLLCNCLYQLIIKGSISYRRASFYSEGVFISLHIVGDGSLVYEIAKKRKKYMELPSVLLSARVFLCVSLN